MAIDKFHLHLCKMVWTRVDYKHLRNILDFSVFHLNEQIASNMFEAHNVVLYVLHAYSSGSCAVTDVMNSLSNADASSMSEVGPLMLMVGSEPGFGS